MSVLDIIGNALTTWVEVHGSPEIDVDGAGYEVQRRYRVAVGSLGANLPALGSADAEYPTALLRKYRIGGTKAYPEVTCVFRTNPDVSPAPVSPIGTVLRRAGSTPEQVPIEFHPNFVRKKTDDATGAVTVTMDYGGVEVDYTGLETFLAPRPTYSYVETVSKMSVTWDEATIVGRVGWLRKPPHMDGTPTETKWLQTDRTIDERGDAVEIGETFQYHPDGYSGKVYRVESIGNYSSS